MQAELVQAGEAVGARGAGPEESAAQGAAGARLAAHHHHRQVLRYNGRTAAVLQLLPLPIPLPRYSDSINVTKTKKIWCG